jgi:hypothetical protein
MQWGFGYSSRQFCACRRDVRCAFLGRLHFVPTIPGISAGRQDFPGRDDL